MFHVPRSEFPAFLVLLVVSIFRRTRNAEERSPCSMFHVPRSMFHVPRSIFYVLRSIHVLSISELLLVGRSSFKIVSAGQSGRSRL